MERESLFSHVRKNLTSQGASLSVDGTMSSILALRLIHYRKNESGYTTNSTVVKNPFSSSFVNSSDGLSINRDVRVCITTFLKK